ncbi:hypothetical protein ASD24_29670 [Paenibacillus sp. Root52]|uniref:hypothetical protein n=1 Tax=Paenibacillus sp. Root52 TaxID=1736552 RepID=UPI0007005AAF|nr:hypothetical protein [Paenibacillus sp. Root52]KQY83608.1 hypothetical protein ASD24_29670 [Paenibacillus sp. Root52]
MSYTYKPDDMFYDVLSLNNIFIVTWWLPAVNVIIVSYLDDLMVIDSSSKEDEVRKYIYLQNPKLWKYKTEIVFENLGNTGCIREFNPDPGKTGGYLGLQSFAKRLGLTNAATYINAHIDQRDVEVNGVRYHPAFYPVKQTDPDYDELQHGYRFGYNSKHYHTTILAELFSRIHPAYFTTHFINQPVLIDRETPLTANDLHQYHKELHHEPWLKSMSQRLAYGMSADLDEQGDYNRHAWLSRKGWLLSGRFIDVSRLNEKLKSVELKRLLATLGLPIKEPRRLECNAPLSSIEQVADHMNCSIFDVINLQTLFEEELYQNSFHIRGKLLDDYPQTIFASRIQDNTQNQTEQADTGNYLNIRENRLTRDSSSASFVEYAIAPYKPIKDIEKVSFFYPSEIEAKKLGIIPSDILEDTKDFFERNVTSDPKDPAHQDFMQVYEFYDSIRGRNFNQSSTYREHYPNGLASLDKSYINELMTRYNTNLFYFNKNEDGKVFPSSCYANFSIGGIHGAEINVRRLREDLEESRRDQIIQEYVEGLYPSITEALKGDLTVTIPQHIQLPKRFVGKVSNDHKIPLHEFTKFGSLQPNAVWRDKTNVGLFKRNSSGNWTIQSRYNFVTSGSSLHQDYESFFPVLLSRLSVFLNPSYHGYKEDGEPADPYYKMYMQRIQKKRESKDQSLPEGVRDIIKLEQESRKLLINAASGIADAKFDNNIRANNAIISMRIIGQLFTWRIGQALTSAGARVASTNTDGLYTMDISKTVNNQILQDVSKDMYLKIDSSTLDHFVSKDSNSRLECNNGRILSAKGSSLSSWGGPQLTQNLDHPAIVDYILSKYLASYVDPVNQPYQSSAVNLLLHEFINEHLNAGTPQTALRYFQWIISSSINTHRYLFKRSVQLETGEITNQALPRHNRVFMTDIQRKEHQEIKITACSPINNVSWEIRYKEYQKGDRPYSAILDHDPDALEVLLQNGIDLKTLNRNPVSLLYKHEAKTQKIKGMPEGQQIAIFNNSVIDLPHDRAVQMINALDLRAYARMIEKSFNLWSNI